MSDAQNVVVGNQSENPNEGNSGADLTDDLSELLPILEGGDEADLSAADDDASDDAADPDEGTSDEATPAEIKDDVIVEVKGQKVPLSELKAGYERTQDYTAKTMQFADHQRDWVARSQAAVTQERQATVQFMPNVVEKVIEAFAPRRSPQEIHQMVTADPASYASYQAQQALADQLRMWSGQISSEAVTLAQTQHHAYAQQVVQAELQKLKERPFFSEKWMQDAKLYGLKHGIPEARLSEYVYTGEMDVLDKAMRWDAAQERLKQSKQAPKAGAQVAQKGRSNGTAFVDAKKFKDIEQRAQKGDTHARASYLSALLPEQ